MSGHFEGEDRRSPHENCTQHSGMNVKLNIQLFIGGVGMIMLATLLSVTIDTYTTVKSSAVAMQEFKAEVKDDMGKIEDRVSALEIRSARLHPDDKQARQNAARH